MTDDGTPGRRRRLVRIATRGSALAMAQARLVAAALADRQWQSELVIVETEGDRRAPDTAWGEGAFVTAIERALHEGRGDIAVHSAKDLPTDEDPSLRLAWFLPREDPRDALVVAAGAGATLGSLAAGSVVGTDSPRRTGFLRAHRPDLDVRPLHGNVDTRLHRLEAAEVDALVLAVAGLVRLGREDRIGERIASDVVPPAPGQGAICVQVRADDEELIRLGALIDHLPTRWAVETERAFLRAAGGGCRAPIGALAEITGPTLRLRGGFATVDGRATAVDEIEGPLADAERLARELAARLSSLRARQAGVGGRRVLVTRPAEQSRRLVARLAEHGLAGVVVPAIEIELAGPGGDLDRELQRLATYAWAIVTSANGARAVHEAAARVGADPALVRWAAVGEATARELRACGVHAAWRPADASGAALARELPTAPGERLLLVRGSLADDSLTQALRGRGAETVEAIGYRTREAPPASQPLLEHAVAAGAVDAVVFASPSAVRGLLALAGAEMQARVLAVPAICIGPQTTAAARAAGFGVLVETSTRDASDLADMTARLLDRPPAGVPT